METVHGNDKSASGQGPIVGAENAVCRLCRPLIAAMLLQFFQLTWTVTIPIASGLLWFAPHCYDFSSDISAREFALAGGLASWFFHFSL